MDNTIYIGKYVPRLEKILENGGVIELPESELDVKHIYVGIGGAEITIDDRIVITVKDGDFSPYICKVTDEEARKLIDKLNESIETRKDPNYREAAEKLLEEQKTI